eukprot:scaffold186761_cov35-Tisochrysis_lutea.AAC.1
MVAHVRSKLSERRPVDGPYLAHVGPGIDAAGDAGEARIRGPAAIPTSRWREQEPERAGRRRVGRSAGRVRERERGEEGERRRARSSAARRWFETQKEKRERVGDAEASRVCF